MIFSELIYNYRVSIPKNDLPRQVTSRNNCWYGKDCNTQNHNLMHAKKLNHICDNIKGNNQQMIQKKESSSESDEEDNNSDDDYKPKK